MINIEKVDYVMNATGRSYEEVREALLENDGNVDRAISYLKGKEKAKEGKGQKAFTVNTEKLENIADEIVSSIKEIWNKGNATKLLVEDKSGEVILNIPLTASAITMALNPLLVLFAIGGIVVTTANFKIVMDDGKIIDIKEYINEKKFREKSEEESEDTEENFQEVIDSEPVEDEEDEK